MIVLNRPSNALLQFGRLLLNKLAKFMLDVLMVFFGFLPLMKKGGLHSKLLKRSISKY